jgi:hydroxymethylglutaryl-CoA reductase (NADPH)
MLIGPHEEFTMRLNYHGKAFELEGTGRWGKDDGTGLYMAGLNFVDALKAEEFINELIGLKQVSTGKDRRSIGKDRRVAKDRPGQESGEKSDVKIIRVPHDDRRNYDPDYVAKRRQWLEEMTHTKLSHIGTFSGNTSELHGNIENFVGIAQVPIGLVGPLGIHGDNANGTYYVPLATTEGALITTFQRGAIAITKAGGAKVRVYRDENYLDPVFVMKDLDDADHLVSWVQDNLMAFRVKVSEVTNHGKLLRINPVIIGRRVVLKISFQTEDAMGANMVNMATESICKFVREKVAVEDYFLRSNFSSEKKAAGVNLTSVYGKEVYAEVIIPKRVVKLYLYSSPERIAKAWHSWALGSIHAGMLGINAHLANGLSGLYIACGQDVAHVTNASVGINMLELLDDGDLYASLKLPNLIVGTIGGGTALGTQRECLEILGCYGSGKAKKFAEIVAATLLAGELGICAGLTTDEFLTPHVRANSYTKAKAYGNLDGDKTSTPKSG